MLLLLLHENEKLRQRQQQQDLLQLGRRRRRRRRASPKFPPTQPGRAPPREPNLAGLNDKAKRERTKQAPRRGWGLGSPDRQPEHASTAGAYSRVKHAACLPGLTSSKRVGLGGGAIPALLLLRLLHSRPQHLLLLQQVRKRGRGCEEEGSQPQASTPARPHPPAAADTPSFRQTRRAGAKRGCCNHNNNNPEELGQGCA